MNAHTCKWSSKSALSRAIQQSEFHQWICLKITSKLVSNFCSETFHFRQGLDKSLVLCWYTCPFFLFFSHVQSSMITSTNIWMTNCRKHLFHPYNYYQKQWKLLLERLQSTGCGSELKWCGHFQHTLFTSDSRAHKLEKTGALHGFGISYVTIISWSRDVYQPVHTCCLWYSPMCIRIQYAWRSETCPASYNLCHKSLVPDCYTSLFAKIFIFLER